MLADGNGVEAGSESTEPLFANSTSWPGAIFALVPRRSSSLECHFYPHQSGWISSGPGGTSTFGTGAGPTIPVPQPELGRIRFANPLYGRYPQWQPQTLPATKLVGDVEVRLTNCVAGISVSVARDLQTGKQTYICRAPVAGEAGVVHFDLDMVSTHGTNERWLAQSTVLSDATGNALTNGYFISQSGTFWPDERAVRLHVELKRNAGFPAADLVTFSNLPLPAPNATNGTTLTNVVRGILILARNFSTEMLTAGQGFQRTGRVLISERELEPPAPYRIEVELPAILSGEVVDLLDTTTDAGEKLDYRSDDDSGHFRRRSYSSLPAGAKSLTVTVAVQKLRAVDFFVKPVTPK
jgi:hypothetical protein